MMLKPAWPEGSNDAEIRRCLVQVQASLDAAAAAVETDPDAAVDDILAARLLVGTLLVKLAQATTERG